MGTARRGVAGAGAPRLWASVLGVLGGRREASDSSPGFPGLFAWLSTQKVLGSLGPHPLL